MADGCRVTVSDVVAAPIDRVWRLVADFGGLDKVMDAVERCDTEGEGIGMLRRIPLEGDVVVERLDELDATAHRLGYSIVSGPLPFRDYRATIQLAPAGDGTRVEWTGTFEAAGVPAEQAETLARTIYTSAIGGFKKLLEGA